MKNSEKDCSYCGSHGVYAKGLCRKCYMRKRNNGFVEYKSRGGKRPWLYSENTKKILQMHRDGVRQRDIVKAVGLTRQAVSLVIKNHASQTNYNRIVSMSIEELAGWFGEYLGCHPKASKEICGKYRDCSECWLDYLEQDA